MIYIDALRIVPRDKILRFKNTFVISYSPILSITLIKSPEAFLTGVSIAACVRSFLGRQVFRGHYLGRQVFRGHYLGRQVFHGHYL